MSLGSSNIFYFIGTVLLSFRYIQNKQDKLGNSKLKVEHWRKVSDCVIQHYRSNMHYLQCIRRGLVWESEVFWCKLTEKFILTKTLTYCILVFKLVTYTVHKKPYVVVTLSLLGWCLSLQYLLTILNSSLKLQPKQTVFQLDFIFTNKTNYFKPIKPSYRPFSSYF